MDFDDDIGSLGGNVLNLRYQELENELTHLLEQGKPIPKQTQLKMAFTLLWGIDDEDKKLRAFERVVKLFDSDVGIDDDELRAKTPKQVLQLIAKLRGEEMTPYHPAME